MHDMIHRRQTYGEYYHLGREKGRSVSDVTSTFLASQPAALSGGHATLLVWLDKVGGCGSSKNSSDMKLLITRSVYYLE